MDKVNCLRNIIEPFDALLWLSAMYCQPLTLPARYYSTAIHKACPYIYGQAACTVVESWFNHQRLVH